MKLQSSMISETKKETNRIKLQGDCRSHAHRGQASLVSKTGLERHWYCDKEQAFILLTDLEQASTSQKDEQ